MRMHFIQADQSGQGAVHGDCKVVWIGMVQSSCSESDHNVLSTHSPNSSLQSEMGHQWLNSCQKQKAVQPLQPKKHARQCRT